VTAEPVHPPILGPAIARNCTRWLRDHNCGKPAVRHVIWDAELENGFVCDEHLDEIGTRWKCLAMHAVGPDCAMPGSLFFLEGLLVRRPQARVLVLERGQHHPVAWQLAQQRSSAIDPRATFRVPPGHKPDWDFTVGLGGGTNCWYAQTPRFHPNDFRTASLYGVGRDWPVGYDGLEPYYVRAERRMAVSGSEVMGRVLPRSAPFPLPPHRVTRADELMQAAQPERHFAIATARASVKTPERNRCTTDGREGH